MAVPADDPPVFTDVDRAAAYLQELPRPWNLDYARAYGLAPTLARNVARRGWVLLEEPLLRYLTAPAPWARSNAAVLTARVRDLPHRATARPRCSRCRGYGSLVHGRALCVRCSLGPAPVPAADPAARLQELRALLRNGLQQPAR
ncbi:hypothetical protein [Streptomyces sp. CAI-85]|uniref:hypothetical protein n=1 Tax=Streptomyces sp. CAI-85 TaxID=1472662 RepID=UPI00158704DB|nr:hypothetical protein [Streptomyces sp. CAI-85]NUV64991.1 hypothetical protein [Streptomyces sp. CAI-85]